MLVQCQHKAAVLLEVLQWMQKDFHPNVRIIFSCIVFDKTQFNLVKLADMQNK
jgi:hypothetical protein